MDSDISTAFALHFQDQSFDLRRVEEDRYQDATIWLSFFPSRRSLSMDAYDGELSAITHNFASRNPEDVAGFIREVEAHYGTKVPEVFRTSVEDYLRHLEGALGFSAEISEPSECEDCGPTINHLEAFYFPAFEEGGPASLAVQNYFGCQGSDEVYGDPADPTVRDTALRILRSAAEKADRDHNDLEIKLFIENLEGILDGRGSKVDGSED